MAPPQRPAAPGSVFFSGPPTTVGYMQREHEPGAGIYLYLAAVTALSGASILLLYLLFRHAVPSVFTGFAQAPVAAIRNNPAGVGLFVLTLGVIALLVTTIVVFGARVDSTGPPDDHRDDG